MMAINTLRDIGKGRKDAPIMIIIGIAITSATSMARITTMTTGMDMATTMIQKALERVKGPDGVLILTDMFGGTPTNISSTFLD